MAEEIKRKITVFINQKDVEDSIRGVGKEIHYFDKNFDRGIKWYKSFFPTKRKKSKLKYIKYNQRIHHI